MGDRTDQDALRWFGHVKKMGERKTCMKDIRIGYKSDEKKGKI